MNRGELLKTGIESTKKKHSEDHHWRAYTTERNKYNRLLKFHQQKKKNK